MIKINLIRALTEKNDKEDQLSKYRDGNMTKQPKEHVRNEEQYTTIY